MICPLCKSEMEIKDVLISRTTDPKDDDLFEKMYVCENCDLVEQIIDLDDEE